MPSRGSAPTQPTPHRCLAEPGDLAGDAAVAGGLREDAPSHAYLNRAAARIDDLGRRLHGLGYVRAREIADCLTAALADLAASHALAEETRAEAAHRAIGRLEGALEHAAAGVLPGAT
ncbi:MAG: hypothetical protein ACJ8J0_09725 [Longimicrobiaceae bacterium]